MSTPKVFISATSGDLRSVRQIVKEALLTINCHPVEQTNFEPDWRTVEGVLRAKIAGCQALIHIAGMCYGAEPDPDTLPSGATRRSYTQMEYHLGRELQRELSVVLNKLGGLAVSLGDPNGALRSFTGSKAIFERLAAADPANDAWQYDL